MFQKMFMTNSIACVLFALVFISMQNKTSSQETIVYASESIKEYDGDIAREDFLDRYNPKSHVREKELSCLARNIYFEARGESKLEQIAVGMVTKNRVVAAPRGTSFCQIVYAPYQFSWTMRDSHYKTVRDKKTWNEIYGLAQKIYDGELYYDPTKGAEYFYSHKILKTPPKWAKDGYDVVKLEGHVYMKVE